MFFAVIVTAHRVTIAIAVATKMSAGLLNSGTVGLGDAEVAEESEKISYAVVPVPIISPLPES